MNEERKVIIKVNDNGSLRVTGAVELVDAEGNPFDHKESFSLCRCGASNNKPFCDGTHKTIGFQSAPRAKKSE
jgi:CDGSH-type Zn-finger protein